VRHVPAQQFLDDIALDQDRAEGTGEVPEQRREAVVQIGMDDDLHRLRGQEGERFQGRFAGADVVVPAGQAEGEILAEVADGAGAGGQGGAGILQG